MPLALLIVVPSEINHMLASIVSQPKSLQVFVGCVADEHANFGNFLGRIDIDFLKGMAFSILGLEQRCLYPIREL